MMEELEVLKKELQNNVSLEDLLDYFQIDQEQLWQAITKLFYEDLKSKKFEISNIYFSYLYELLQLFFEQLDEKAISKSVLKLQRKINSFSLQTTDATELFQYETINNQLEVLYLSIQTRRDFVSQTSTFCNLIFYTEEYNFVELLMKKNPNLVNATNETGKPLLYLLIDTYFFYLKKIEEYDGMNSKAIYYHSLIALFLKQKELRIAKDEILEYINNHCQKLPIHLCYETKENLKNMLKSQYEIPSFTYQRGLKEWLSRMPQEQGHYDFSTLYTMTIDTEKAHLLDDALSIEILENGNYLFIVHVANVISELEKELPFEKILEAKLNHCATYTKENSSLRQGQSKEVLSHLYEFDPSGKFVDFQLVRASIVPDINLTFGDITPILEDNHENPLSDTAYDIYHLIKKITQLPKEKETQLRSKGGYLVERCMVLTNHTIARIFQLSDAPFLYKVQPGLNLRSLHRYLYSPEQLKRELDILQHKIAYGVKPCYANENIGYYKRGLPVYSHVTSPIIERESRIVQALEYAYLLDESIEKETKDQLCREMIKEYKLQKTKE